MSRLATCLVVGATLSLSLACGATRQGRKAEARGFLGDYSKLAEHSERDVRLSYLDDGAPWASYEKILLDPLQFWRSSDVDAGLAPEEAQALADYGYARLREELARDYEMAGGPGPGTLRVSIAFTRVGERNVTLDTVSTYLPQARVLTEAGAAFTGKPAFVGHATMEAKLTDATTGEVVGAAVDTRVGGKAIKNFDDWVDVRKAIDKWAELLAIRLCVQRGEEVDACKQR